MHYQDKKNKQAKHYAGESLKEKSGEHSEESGDSEEEIGFGWDKMRYKKAR